MSQISRLKEAIKDIYSSVQKLNLVFPDKPFTPDGRMVGDIGEVIAALKFDIKLDKKLRRHWDGYRVDFSGKKHEVQVKATQKDETYLKKPPCEGDLIVFKINKDGNFKCYYNGSIMKVWKALESKKSNKVGENLITLKKLEEIK